MTGKATIAADVTGLWTPKFRLTVAFGVGLLAAGFVLSIAHVTDGAPDFDQWYTAAQAFRNRDNPYDVIRQSKWGWPLLYPFTTILAVLPLTALPVPFARATFAGVGAGLLAYGLSREPWRLWLLVSGAMVAALYFVQWSPWLVAAVLLPRLGAVLVCKPSIGLALGLTHFSRPLVIGAVAMTALSILAWPSWPAYWLEAIRETPDHNAPLTRPGGFLLLLALLRWRHREAWLLLAIAIVPQTILVHEALPLGLVTRSRREMQAFAVLTLVACAIMLLSPAGTTHTEFMAYNWWPMLGLAYLPALVMVLRQPNGT